MYRQVLRCCGQQDISSPSRPNSTGKGLPNNLECNSLTSQGSVGPTPNSQRHGCPSNGTPDRIRLDDKKQQIGDVGKCGNTADSVPDRKGKMNHSCHGKEADKPREAAASKARTKVCST